MSGSDEFFGLKVPFLTHLGVKAELGEGGRSRISLELRPELLNSFEVSHGGVVMTMLDVAMAMAARTSHAHVGGIMTVDMSVSFIRAAKGRIVAHGKLLRGGNSLHFCEGEAFDESGELVAKSLGTFKLHHQNRNRAQPAA